MRRLPIIASIALLHGCHTHAGGKIGGPGPRPFDAGASGAAADAGDSGGGGGGHDGDGGVTATGDMATTAPPPPTGGWEWLNPRPTGDALSAVWSDGIRAWAVGSHGTALYTGDGVNWSLGSTATYAALFGVWGSGDTVWAVGEKGTLLQSIDGGKTWNSIAAVAQSTTSDLHGVWAAGSTVFVAGDSGAILRGDTSGFKILPGPSGTLTNANLRTVWGRSADDVWIGGQWGAILHATDRTNFIASGNAGGDVSALTGDATNLWTIAGSVYGHFNGAKWTTRDLNPGVAEYYYGVWAPAVDDVFVVGYGANLIHSIDDFATRTGGPIADASATLNAIWGQGDGALIAGMPGVLLATSDHAKSWQSRISGPHSEKDSHAAIWAIDEAHLFVAGGGGHVWRSTDGGETWIVLATGISDDIAAVVASADGTVVAAGASPQISSVFIRSRDFGDHWQKVTPAQSINSLWLDGGILYATAYDGQFIRSSDFGDHWSNAVGLSLCDKVWASGQSVVVAGVNQTTYYSTDGGASFHASDHGSMASLWGSGPTNIWAGGLNGVVMHSIDGGKTWSSQNLGTTFHVLALTGRSTVDVFAAASESVFHTRDGGSTWEQLPPLPYATALWASDQHLYAAGYSGAILRIAR